MNSNKNLTNSHNFQSLHAKVIYFLKNRIITTKQFLLSSTFSTIFEYFEKNILPISNTKLKNEYLYNNKKIDLNEPLVNFIEFKKNSSSSTIQSVEIFVELEENINDDISPIFNILIQPKENLFGLYVFNSKEGIITVEQYPENIIKKYELDKISINYSSYCNSPKHLYISGGKLKNNNTELTNDFWIINNRKYSIVQKKMPYKKLNHSMIYIYLANKEYIFIAGGDNNLMTFYYDINMSSFVIWTNMNYPNKKPSLCQFNQYLYSFNSFNIYNNSIYFERTNLVTGKPNWEKIEPKYDINIIKLNFLSKNFGVCKSPYNEILFLGGADADKNITIYDPIRNILSIQKDKNNIKTKLSDKYFYNINKEHYIALPSSLSTKKEIAVVNIVKQSIRLIPLKINNGKIKTKIKENKEKEENFGNIIINAKIHERLRFEIQPEIFEAQKLSFGKNNNFGNEKEIIKIDYIPEINKDENKNKVNKKRNMLYVTNDNVYNNFVNLVVTKFKLKK